MTAETVAKHTPGPWRVERSMRRFNKDAPFEVWGKYLIAEIIGPTLEGDAEANARLITAAPRMLEALERLVDGATAKNFPEPEMAECFQCNRCWSTTGADAHADNCPVPAARAVLREAKGGTP